MTFADAADNAPDEGGGAPVYRDIRYSSENLVVRSIRPFASRSLVISFCSREEADSDLQRPGFGEAFLLKYGIDAVHIICAGNHWYQYPDVELALAAAAAERGKYAEAVAMGWSMGGYAAINFSQALGVNRIIAVSPQFSWDQRITPFETRWRTERRRLHPHFDRISALPPDGATTFVVYDDRHPEDRQHVELIRRHIDIVPIALPNSGHPAGSVLATLGLLSGTFTQMIDGTFDRDAFAALLAEPPQTNPAAAAKVRPSFFSQLRRRITGRV